MNAHADKLDLNDARIQGPGVFGLSDYWIRRSALLAQLLFFRADENGDRKIFFDMAQSQFDESWIDKVYKDTQTKKRARFFIRKAIGWVLREMSIKQPNVVAEFANKYIDQMSDLTFREATRKLPKKHKN